MYRHFINVMATILFTYNVILLSNGTDYTQVCCSSRDTFHNGTCVDSAMVPTTPINPMVNGIITGVNIFYIIGMLPILIFNFDTNCGLSDEDAVEIKQIWGSILVFVGLTLSAHIVHGGCDISTFTIIYQHFDGNAVMITLLLATTMLPVTLVPSIIIIGAIIIGITYVYRRCVNYINHVMIIILPIDKVITIEEIDLSKNPITNVE